MENLNLPVPPMADGLPVINAPALQNARGPVQNPPAPDVLRDAAKFITFAQLFNDETRDPCGREYGRVMNRFAANPQDAVASATLFNQVTGVGSRQLNAYLCCGTGKGGPLGPRIYCVLFPSKYAASINGDPTFWDNLTFAFLGDVIQGQATTVIFPNDAFDTVTTRTRTSAYMLQHLNDLTTAMPLFPPVADDEADALEVTVRKVIYLPAVYVPLFLSAGGYTIKQAWDRLFPALHQRQDLEVCAPLLQWLQVASTGSALPDLVTMGDPSVAFPLNTPPADEELLTQRLQFLHQLLPGLTAPPQSLETALTQMAAAIVTQTNDSRLVREQRAATELEPKLPSEKFTVTLPILLEYLQVADERHLPSLWHQWANCKKRQEFQVLRDALDAFARGPTAFISTVPVVTAKLVQDLLSFNFVSDSADDFKMGLHPFIITDGNSEHRHTNLEVARLYSYLNSGETSISLADLEALQAKEVRSVPLTYWELEKHLGSFGNLLGVVLGMAHPLSQAYAAMWQMLKSGLRDELHTAIEYRAYVKPTHILRSIQLGFYTWFSHRRTRLTPPQPDFVSILNQILLQVYILPRLPPTLYHLAYPKRVTQDNSASLPGLITTGSASGSSSGSTGSGGDAASLISGLTGTSSHGKPPPTGGRGAYVANLHVLPALQALDKPDIKIKDIMGTTSPPKMANGTEICLSYHLRGGCWTNCRRAPNHQQTLTPEDIQRLSQYLTRRTGALQPAPAPANTSGASVTAP
jgi:hypothetical protein